MLIMLVELLIHFKCGLFWPGRGRDKRFCPWPDSKWHHEQAVYAGIVSYKHFAWCAVSVCCKLVSLQWSSETTRVMHFYLVNWKITVGWWCSVCGRRCCSWNEGHYRHFLLAMSLECLANLMTGSSHCFWNFDGNSGCRFCVMFCLKLWADSSILIYIHHLELMKSVGSHGSLSLLFMTKVMVWHFVSNSHKSYDCTHQCVILNFLLRFLCNFM